MFHLFLTNKSLFRLSSPIYFTAHHSQKGKHRHHSPSKDSGSGSATHYAVPASDSYTNASAFSGVSEGELSALLASHEISKRELNLPALREALYNPNTGGPLSDAFFGKENSAVADTFYEKLFEKSKEELLAAAKINDTRIVRGFLKNYPGDKNPQELEPLPDALLLAATNGHWPTVRLLLEKHDALRVHQRDAYIQALRQGFSTATKEKYTSVVQEVLPKMRRLHDAGYTDLYYLTTLRQGLSTARQYDRWAIFGTILPFLANADYQAYVNCLCEQLKEAANNGQSDQIEHLLPQFRKLRNKPGTRNAYADTLNRSTFTAITRALDWKRPEVANLLVYDFLALVRAQPDNPNYRETLYQVIRYVARIGNLSLVNQALPLCKHARRHNSEQFSKSLSSAYWQAEDSIILWNKNEIKEAKRNGKDYIAIMKILEPYYRGWGSWDERNEYGPYDSD
jgi:hypothetical protein